MHLLRHFLFFLFASACLSELSPAAVTLPPLLSDHAVLQKSDKTRLWGTADPGEKITATLANASGTATAGSDGKWKIELNLTKTGSGPFDLIIQGTNKITVTDVLVGEVWVASGQSNMEFPLKYADNAGKEIAASTNPLFHEFHVENKASASPVEETQGKWVVAGPTTSGLFTAVGYYFCLKLQQELGVPVGLIHSSWGGTPIEAWTSHDTLESVPEMKVVADASRDAYEGFPGRSKVYADAVQAWESQYQRELPSPTDPAPFAAPNIDTSGWKTVYLPGALAAAGLPEAGTIWLRRTVTLPRDVVAGKPPLIIGQMPGFDTVYWNGVKLGETTPESGGTTTGRRYLPPSEVQLREGDGVLAIRISVPVGGAAVSGSVRWGGSLTLDGDWLAKAEKELPPVTAEAKAAFPKALQRIPSPQVTSSYLYNGMISPLTPASIRGAIWYQGEGNADRGFQYGTALPLMIQNWRASWGEGDFPFYYCQLANCMPRKPAPSESGWAAVRDGQRLTLSQPNTGMAVLIDCGDVANIHPHNKRTPGERLAAITLANTYGKKISYSGPLYAGMTVEGNAVRVRFRHVDGGLVAKPLPTEYASTSVEPDKKEPLVRNVPNSPLEGFALCGADHVWKWANATISGDTVVVTADGITDPVAVRYGWADDPICNLYNQADFPASPFRSDDFK